MIASLPAPLRRFGQNFLQDPRWAERLIERFEPTPRDVVVEIGPGRGALTIPLAPCVGRLVALELDRRQIEPLQHALAPWPQAEVRAADALTIDFDRLAEELGGTIRVIGNLPYNVGTAIVRRLVDCHAVRDVHVVLQLEVVERLLAVHGSKRYGALSVILAWTMIGRQLLTLPPGAFRPTPKVTSAAVRFVRRVPALVAPTELQRFERFVQRGFAHRRKTLAGNLAPWRGLVESFLTERALPRDARAEMVPAERWLELARQLDASGVAP